MRKFRKKPKTRKQYWSLYLCLKKLSQKRPRFNHMYAPYRFFRLFAFTGLNALAGIGTCALAAPPQLILGASPSDDVIAMAQADPSKAINALPEIVERIMERSGVPGMAVAVVHDNEVLFRQGFGVREVGKVEPVNEDTVFMLASLTKSLTASLIATQVTQGKVNWTDPVVQHLPTLRLKDAYVTEHATIGDFMAHRTGLPFAAGDALEDLGYNRNDILEKLHLLELNPFRSSYAYANFGTTTAGQAVAAASGQSYEALLKADLFLPLGMNASSARHKDYLAQDNRAALHALANGDFKPLYERDPDAQAPAGGVSSSIKDMSQWLRFLLGNGQFDGKTIASEKALTPAMSLQTITTQVANDTSRPSAYGFGFDYGINANGRTTISHSGAFLLGTGTHFRIVPSADLGIVVLTNASPVGAAEAIAAEFIDLVSYGEITRDWYAGYNHVLSGMFDPIGDLVGEAAPTEPKPAMPLNEY
ncbi:MAG TPA: serine hydrolase, partial [Pusillimonas sp.]|nr:serine hydrolase [Pusillimonas sp.]